MVARELGGFRELLAKLFLLLMNILLDSELF